MDKRNYLLFALPLLAIALILGGIASTGFLSKDVKEGIQYDGYVTVAVNGEVISQSHNLLYNDGANMVRDILGGGASGAVLNISLNNATASGGADAPVAAGTEAFTAISSCDLISIQGAYTSLGSQTGNWTVSKTFTVNSACSGITTNVTRLTNNSGTLFAGNTFTSTTLQGSDQITINWTLSVKNG